MPSRPLSLDPPTRVPLVDAARGVALLAMAIYHFAFDLKDLGFWDVDVVGDPAWRLYARLVAASFLALVGVSLVLAARVGLDRRRFVMRLAKIVAAAALISFGTWFMMPGAFVYFGILHAIALFSVLALPFLRWPVWVAVAAALACLVARPLLSGPIFDAPPLLWLGLAESPRLSIDYVPLLPWFAATLLGLAATRLAIARGLDRRAAALDLANPVARPFVVAGRWSLLIYLIHQPILIGLLILYARL